MPRSLALVAGLALVALGCGKGEAPTDAPPRAPRTVGVLPAVSLASTSEEDTAAEVAAIAGDDPLSPRCEGVRLLLVKTVNKWGGPGPGFSATLYNQGSKPVTLVEAGDGSDVGWRTPVISWKLTTPDGTIVAPGERGARCGNMNSLQLKEIFTLAPRQKHVLSEWLGAPEALSGPYDVRLVYDNDPKREVRRASESSAEAIAAVKKSTVCRVESNAVRVVY